MSSASPFESGAVLRALAGAISDAVVILNRDGRYLDVISRRAELLVKPADELLGRTIHDVFPAETADLFLRWINRALDTGRTVEDEYEAEIGGRRAWFAAIVSPLTDTTVIWIARDITERKVLEAQLRQAAKMEAVGRLAGGVAHDFNNLLTAISTNADLALGALASGQDVHDEIGQIKRAGERAAALTRQLLAFSRKQMLQPRVLAINDAVRGANELVERLIGEDVQLITVLDEDTWPVVADADQLLQVVMNLAVNARDAMPNGGVLTVTTGNLAVTRSLAERHRGVRAGEYVVLTMRDTGAGMDHATQERVFEPFFTTKEQGKGTGLGLATVYGIVKQSGGSIQLVSEPGRGTTFWIFLPRAHDAVQAPTDVGPLCAPARAMTGATVLIVEDEPQVRGAASRVLRAYGYAVIEAPNGLDALAVWKERRDEIALIVTDVVMPQLGGRELVRRLRADGATVPVLFISGYAEGATPERTDDTGRSAFLAKPFDIDVFVRLAAELIRDARVAQATVLETQSTVP
jgi:two-component system, cell cycle sensor histidine kinase and response regulator CckA